MILIRDMVPALLPAAVSRFFVATACVSALILAGAGIASGDLSVAAAVIVGIVFIALTAPVATHLLTRAALKSGVEPAAPTNIEK